MIESMAGPDLDRPLRAALPLLRKATGVDGAMAGPVSLGGRRLVVTGLARDAHLDDAGPGRHTGRRGRRASAAAGAPVRRR